MAVAPDLELDLGGLLVLLYPGGYIVRNIISFSFGNRESCCVVFWRILRRTGGILSPADLDELLNVGDFLGHDGRLMWLNGVKCDGEG